MIGLLTAMFGIGVLLVAFLVVVPPASYLFAAVGGTLVGVGIVSLMVDP
jgi:hypothetical protein